MKRVYIGHLQDAHQWASTRDAIARVAKIQSWTRLFSSHIARYHFAFIVLQTYEDAVSVLRVVGREKFSMDVDFEGVGWEPRVYAEWARPKNKVSK